MPERPERLIIRPPSEWRSVLVRVTRGCAWNRCRFCGQYPFFGEPYFSRRSVEEIKEDIDRIARRHPEAETAFCGDADPLLIPREEFTEIARHIYLRFPRLKRLTCYARASTLRKKKRTGLQALASAGLKRVHVGLESGDEDLLRFHRKGQTPEMVIEVGKWLKDAGIELSLYALLGMGGRGRWQEHVAGTAAVLNEVNPEFIRLRRLWLYQARDQGEGPECPLWEEVREGSFVPQAPEGSVRELRDLLAKLEGIASQFTCDHANNYVQVSGKLPEEKERMLAEVDRFLALPVGEREEVYQLVGSRI